jgi:hypothetical protein
VILLLPPDMKQVRGAEQTVFLHTWLALLTQQTQELSVCNLHCQQWASQNQA